MYAGFHAPRYEDYLFSGCNFRVNGSATACLRMEGVTRGVVLNSTIRTGGRHALRMHGSVYAGQRHDGDLYYVKNLICENSDGPSNGVRVGGMPDYESFVNRCWMKDVIVRATGPEDIDVFHLNGGTQSVAQLNVDNVWSERATWSGWSTINNYSNRPGWTIVNCGTRPPA